MTVPLQTRGTNASATMYQTIMWIADDQGLLVDADTAASHGRVVSPTYGGGLGVEELATKRTILRG